ncbi:hypothetical protein [Pelagicoccus mobilis]|uniref:Uncharacterized protein n=1 Tax=Pelagicoccus mobilis TaxID=415221 RepID=A0A934VR00_9BACT|nr:hypothetical protein [Pelagicoccus mobilis]MBK1877103.1 hypothetical protein [Pelagicoccus mobilis]
MKPIQLYRLFLVIPLVASCLHANTRKAHLLIDLEEATSTRIEELYSDSIVRTADRIWNINTGEMIAGPTSREDFGEFLDFDLSSKRSLYRKAEPHPDAVRQLTVFQVRNQQGEVIFEKKEWISHQPKAFLVDGGKYLLSRSNDAKSFDLMLELHSVDTGELIWQRKPEGSPRWRLSQDSSMCLELGSDNNQNRFQTAIAFDVITQEELSNVDVASLELRKESIYLSRFESSLAVLSGNGGTLIANSASRNLSIIYGFAAASLRFEQSPKYDAEARYVVLHAGSQTFGGVTWAVYNARNGEQIGTSLDYQVESSLLQQGSAPTPSPDGQLLYKVSAPGQIEVWNLTEKTLEKTLSYTNIPFNALVPSPDNRHLLALALSGINDDFMVLLDSETNLPVYSKIVNDPELNLSSGEFGYVRGFTRTLMLPPGGQRFFFQTSIKPEAFNYLTGEPVVFATEFNGKALSSRYVEPESAWVTVYSSGRVRIEKENETTWIQLPNTHLVEHAAIDPGSGSIAIQRDSSFLITHPFDDREDQQITGLSLGIHPISLHGGGKWLAGDYKGIYDLETESKLSLPFNLYAIYAIDYAQKLLAIKDPNSPAVAVYDLSEEPSEKFKTDVRFHEIYDLRFSENGNKLHILARPEFAGWYSQSLYTADSGSGQIQSEFDVSDPEERTYNFLLPHSNGTDIFLSDWDTTFSSFDLNAAERSLPAYPSSTHGVTFIDWAPTGPDGTLRYIDSQGILYHFKAGTATPADTTFTQNPDGSLDVSYLEKPGHEYWNEISWNLKDWIASKDPEAMSQWLDSYGRGFFRVYEATTDN